MYWRVRGIQIEMTRINSSDHQMLHTKYLTIVYWYLGGILSRYRVEEVAGDSRADARHSQGFKRLLPSLRFLSFLISPLSYNRRETLTHYMGLIWYPAGPSNSRVWLLGPFRMTSSLRRTTSTCRSLTSRRNRAWQHRDKITAAYRSNTWSSMSEINPFVLCLFMATLRMQRMMNLRYDLEVTRKQCW